MPQIACIACCLNYISSHIIITLTVAIFFLDYFGTHFHQYTQYNHWRKLGYLISTPIFLITHLMLSPSVDFSYSLFIVFSTWPFLLILEHLNEVRLSTSLQEDLEEIAKNRNFWRPANLAFVGLLTSCAWIACYIVPYITHYCPL